MKGYSNYPSLHNSHLRNFVAKPKNRSVEECMSLSSDIIFCKKTAEFVKRVNREEMDDLWCRGKTIIFSFVPGVDPHFKPVRLSKAMLIKKELHGLHIDASKLPDDFNGNYHLLRLKTIIEAIVRPSLPVKSDEIYYYVYIPVEAKKAPRHASLAV